MRVTMVAEVMLPPIIEALQLEKNHLRILKMILKERLKRILTERKAILNYPLLSNKKVSTGLRCVMTYKLP
jgi:hypothetical protein